MAPHCIAQHGVVWRQLTLSVTLVASLALSEGVGMHAEGAGGTGEALADSLRACAGLGHVCPCRDSGVTGSTATWSNAPAVAWYTVPCHMDRAVLTWGTLKAAPLSGLDPVHVGGTVASAVHAGGMSPQAEEWLLQDPLLLPHGADPPPWGLRFAGRQPQRCQGHLHAGREQGCRQPGCSRSRAPVGTTLTSVHAGLPEPEPYLELCGHRCLHRAERLELPPCAPKPRGCAAPGPGMPRGSPCALPSPQYTSKQLPAGTVGATVPGGLSDAPACSANGASRLAGGQHRDARQPVPTGPLPYPQGWGRVSQTHGVVVPEIATSGRCR